MVHYQEIGNAWCTCVWAPLAMLLMLLEFGDVSDIKLPQLEAGGKLGQGTDQGSAKL